MGLFTFAPKYVYTPTKANGYVARNGTNLDDVMHTVADVQQT